MELIQVKPGVFSWLEGLTHRELRLEQDGDGFVVTLRGRKTRIEIVDPRAWSSQAASQSSSGFAKISSPMPGKVVRLLVAAGDRVVAGQGLVVIEAMKMQNEMKSPIAGMVARVDIAVGASVNGNQVLVVVEADAA